MPCIAYLYVKLLSCHTWQIYITNVLLFLPSSPRHCFLYIIFNFCPIFLILIFLESPFQGLSSYIKTTCIFKVFLSSPDYTSFFYCKDTQPRTRVNIRHPTYFPLFICASWHDWHCLCHYHSRDVLPIRELLHIWPLIEFSYSSLQSVSIWGSLLRILCCIISSLAVAL